MTIFLSLVHLRDLGCAHCSDMLAVAGARSFVVDGCGEPAPFDADDQPAEMRVELTCRNGHVTTLLVPNEIGAEETMRTPDDAPAANDAVLREGMAESGKTLGGL